VLDIGAGLGVITAALVDVGASVIAIENHPARRRALRDRFGTRITLVATDARDLRLPRRPYHVVANPPFAITSDLLRRLVQPGSHLQSATLLLDERAVGRWGGPRAPAAARWRRQFAVDVGPRLPRDALHPAPAVPCRVLTITRR